MTVLAALTGVDPMTHDFQLGAAEQRVPVRRRLPHDSAGGVMGGRRWLRVASAGYRRGPGTPGRGVDASR